MEDIENENLTLNKSKSCTAMKFESTDFNETIFNELINQKSLILENNTSLSGKDNTDNNNNNNISDYQDNFIDISQFIKFCSIQFFYHLKYTKTNNEL